MLPKERPAFFGVTFKARVIYVFPDQQVIVVTVMNVVTAAAIETAKAQAMTAGLERVGANPLVTFETDFLLLERIENRIALLVNGMAAGATDIDRFMHAAKPTHGRLVLVTGQAGFVLGRNRILTVLAERDRDRHFGLFLGLYMRVRRAVAGFALFVREWCVGIHGRTMPGHEDRHHVALLAALVAHQAGVGALGGVFLFRQEAG